MSAGPANPGDRLEQAAKQFKDSGVIQCVCSIEVRPMQRNYSVRKSGRN